MDEDNTVVAPTGPLVEAGANINLAYTTPERSDTFTYMDSELGPSVFEEPVCLIASAPDGKLKANEKAVRQLENIKKTVNCVAITGPSCTGKSYLLNRLAGKRSGFASSFGPKTKGIWVWCIPHPCHADQVLVLLDTEALGDVTTGDQNQNNWIFALAVLLSSTLVYNILGRIEQGHIEKLNFMAEISKHGNSHGCESKDFFLHFPKFVFCLRDFPFDLGVTADGYLEQELKFKEGSDEKNSKYNELKRCICRYFKSRKCFKFERPTTTKAVQKLEELTDSYLDKDFVSNVEEFCRYIHRECPAKILDIGTPVTGRMFVSLVSSYVAAIRNGAIPCIENTLNTMAIDEAVKLYDDFMTKNLSLPTNSDETLSQVHHKAVEESINFFQKNAIDDNDHEYQRKIKKQLEQHLVKWKNRNEQSSVDKCKEVLRNLDTVITTKLMDGVYLCNGGYTMYQQDLQDLQTKYDSTEGLGVKAKETLLAFQRDKWTEGQTIQQADQKFTVEEKKMEEQRQKAVEAERQREAAEKKAELIEQDAKEAERLMKEKFEQLEKKREEDLENMRTHNEKTLQDGFSALHSQINSLKRQLTRSENRDGGRISGQPNVDAKPLEAKVRKCGDCDSSKTEYFNNAEKDAIVYTAVGLHNAVGEENKDSIARANPQDIQKNESSKTESQREHNRLFMIIGDEMSTKSQEFQDFKYCIPVSPRDRLDNDGSAEDLLRIWESRGGFSPGNYDNLLRVLQDAKLIRIRDMAQEQIDKIQKLADNGSPP